MTRLVIPEDQIRYPHDVATLVAAAAAHGYEVDEAAAQWAWKEHSDSYAAGWLILDMYTPEQLVGVLLTYLERRDDE